MTNSGDLFAGLPQGLQSELAKRGWRVVKAERMVGGFAASLYQLRLSTPLGGEVDVVYKRLAPGRTEEFGLYRGVLQEVSGYVPKLLLRVRAGDEQGILIEDAGRPLKAVLRESRDNQGVAGGELSNSDAMAVSRQTHLLQKAVVWLANLHTEYESRSQVWLEQGLLGVYPLASAENWASEALKHLVWLKEQGLCEMDGKTLEFVHTVAEQFYPKYPDYLAGRMTLTHGDPHLENLLMKEQDLRLIDWEYTCVTVPQRDLSIFVQDVLDPHQHDLVVETYWNSMRRAGWRVDEPGFRSTYLACFLDNTLMMLGWEVHKFRQHELALNELEKILSAKLRWLREASEELFG